MGSARVRFSELELEHELEVALRIGTEVSGRVDHAARTAERADETIGVAEVDVVEDVDRLDVELAIDALRELELLEERSVGSPITRPAQRVALLVAEGSRRSGLAEDVQVLDELDRPVGLAEDACLDMATDIRTAGPGVGDSACVNAVVEWQSALDRGGRVELPAADEVVSRS